MRLARKKSKDKKDSLRGKKEKKNNIRLTRTEKEKKKNSPGKQNKIRKTPQGKKKKKIRLIRGKKKIRKAPQGEKIENQIDKEQERLAWKNKNKIDSPEKKDKDSL